MSDCLALARLPERQRSQLLAVISRATEADAQQVRFLLNFLTF